ncbi:MAG TPA: cytochrome c biogenesis protein ResB [Candidatus Bathyarchaeia archaeon]|nr:cytochrome c biogenesis protein ResB [Candidatus Bathyarchaeia archaeon]
MNFAIRVLTSARFAVSVVALFIVISIVGTFVPGGDVVFGSPLFLALIAILAISTVLCSLTRIGPLWHELTRAEVAVSDSFIDSLPYSAHLSSVTVTEVRDNLKGYAIRESKKGGTTFLFAQKGRTGRFGSHIAHFGVLILLLGIATGAAYGYANPYNNKIAVIAQGGSQQIDGFVLRLDNFNVSYYDTGAVRDYKATVTVLDGDRAETHDVTVNGPLTYKGLTFYLYGYDANGVAQSGKASWVAFQIKSTTGIPLVWAGAAVTLAGIMLSLYVPHKRIWIKESHQGVDLGASSNKSAKRFFREIESLCTKLVNHAQNGNAHRRNMR